MSHHLYVVRGRLCVDNSSRWEICVVSDEERAHLLVGKLEELQEYNSIFHPFIEQDFRENYKKIHPPPYKTYQEYQKMSVEESTNYDRVFWKWQTKMLEAEEQWINDNYDPPQHLEEVKQFCDIDGYTQDRIAYDYVEIPLYDNPVFD